MSEQQQGKPEPEWWNSFKILMSISKMIVLVSAGSILYAAFSNYFNTSSTPPYPTTNLSTEDDWDKIENGIHLKTGLIYDRGFDQVRANCTVCHSAKLIIQNRANRDGWAQMISWMQQEQGLWDLGKNESVILDYLSTHYAPLEKGRRDNLNIAEIEWYILDLE